MPLGLNRRIPGTLVFCASKSNWKYKFDIIRWTPKDSVFFWNYRQTTNLEPVLRRQSHSTNANHVRCWLRKPVRGPSGVWTGKRLPTLQYIYPLSYFRCTVHFQYVNKTHIQNSAKQKAVFANHSILDVWQRSELSEFRIFYWQP